MPQVVATSRFPVDHIIARKHGGSDDPSNLALSCPFCNGHKGTNLTGIDPRSREITPLYNPRLHVWAQHFMWDGLTIRGLTAVGRTTVEVLEMNDFYRRDLRGKRF